MDRLEQRLRSTLADERLTLPLRPDATSLVRAGVRRRRRNRAIVTVASAVVLLGGGIAAVSLGSTNAGNERIVPPTGGGAPSGKPTLPTPTQQDLAWAPTPYDYHHPPAFPGAIPDPAVPWCRASQLSLSQSFQGAGGSWAGAVTVTNDATATCAVQGQPAVSLQTAHGHTLLTTRPEPFFVDAWIRLAPGRTATAGVTWLPEFCHEPSVASIRITLPHAGGSLSTGLHGSPRCDADTGVPSVGHLDVDGFVPNPGEPFTPLAGLQAQLDRVPASVLPGSVVDYRLQLQSTGAPSVALDPCLPYRERLVDHSTGVVLREYDYLINCGSPPVTIGNAQSMHSTYFDLQLAVPTSAPVGDYDLIWQSVLKPVNAVAETLVHIGTGPAFCRDGQVVATAGRSGAATGHYVQVVVFRNNSASACTLRGYPGLQLLSKDGQVMSPAPKRGSDFMFQDPGLHTIVLAPEDGTASFSVGGSDYDPVNQRTCPTATQMAVYAPETRMRLIVSVGFPVCPYGINFSAVVAGPDGVR